MIKVDFKTASFILQHIEELPELLVLSINDNWFVVNKELYDLLVKEKVK